MPDVPFTLNGRPATAAASSSVAVAVLANGVKSFRRSVSGQLRAPLCGMGICYECRLSIDGREHQKSCQVVLKSGMAVQTDV
jgi:predicted molibdopterin-dependent oxidoreductase YjgC